MVSLVDNCSMLPKPVSSRLNKHDILEEKSTAPRGILHLPQHRELGGLKRFEPCKLISCFVENYWEVAWVDQPRIVIETVPSPSVHMTFEAANSGIHGICKQKFSRSIEGTGRVLGVKFRPGGFQTFLKRSVSDLTERIVELATVFGDSILQLETEVLSRSTAGKSFAMIDKYLQSVKPTSTSELELVGNVIRHAKDDRTLVRVGQIASEFSIGLRSLQRVFRDYVGVSPKWVIQRFRLIDAAERMRDANADVDLAGLAVELGYSDHAHLIRDFKSFVGMTPGKYRHSLLKSDEPCTIMD